MNIKERKERIEFLKQNMPYKDDFYKRLSDRQVLAIFYKVVAKNQSRKKENEVIKEESKT